MKTLTWQKPGQQNVAQELIKIIINYVAELRFNTYMEALHSLPKELQRVYVMSRYKQLTHKEIADKLEVSVQTVNYRIGKTLQFFRIRLKDFCLE